MSEARRAGAGRNPVAPVGPPRAGPGHGRLAAEAGLAAVAAGWGLTFTLVQDAIRSLPPVTFVAYRFALAGTVLVVPQARALARLPRAGWRAGAVLGMVLFAGYAAQTIGLAHTSASNAGFVTGLYVVFTPLLAGAVGRQRSPLGAWGWSCVAGATAGLALLSGGGDSWHPLGDGLMLACAVCFAVHIVLTDRAVARVPTGPLVAVELSVCGVLASGVSVLTGDVAAPRGWPVWSALLFTAVVASAVALAVQSFAQRRTSPARTALILATEPVFAGVFGFALAGDRLSAASWSGAALMTVAVLAMEVGPAPRPRTSRPSSR